MINWETMDQLAKSRSHTCALSTAYARSRIKRSKIVDEDIAERINVLADGLIETCPPSRSCEIMRSVADIIKEESVMRIFTDEARMHLENPLYSTAAQIVESDIVSGLVLHRHPLLRVTCATTSSSPQMRLQAEDLSIDSSMAVGGYDSFVVFLQARECAIDLFEVDPSMDDRQILLPPVRKEMRTGDHLFLEGGKQGFVLATPQCRVNMILLARQLPRDPLSRLYDRKTRGLVRISSASVRDSRIQNLATALARLEGTRNGDALEQLTHHDSYFVRWHAVRELCSMDETRAYARLKKMAHGDPHEEIRSLSRQLTANEGE